MNDYLILPVYFGLIVLFAPGDMVVEFSEEILGAFIDVVDVLGRFGVGSE